MPRSRRNTREVWSYSSPPRVRRVSSKLFSKLNSKVLVFSDCSAIVFKASCSDCATIGGFPCHSNVIQKNVIIFYIVGNYIAVAISNYIAVSKFWQPKICWQQCNSRWHSFHSGSKLCSEHTSGAPIGLNPTHASVRASGAPGWEFAAYRCSSGLHPHFVDTVGSSANSINKM